MASCTRPSFMKISGQKDKYIRFTAKVNHTMKPDNICPACKGNKIIPGNCECNAEWRGNNDEDGFHDCQCEPDIECPRCKGKGIIGGLKEMI